MFSHDQIIQDLERRLPETEVSIKSVVGSILECLANGRNYFTIRIVRDRLKLSEKNNTDIISILIELSSSRYKFMSMHYHFINDDGELIPVDGDDYCDSLESGEFFDPTTGKKVENHLERIFPYFKVES